MDRFLMDLGRSIQSGELRDSQLAPIVMTCCQLLTPISLSNAYDFASVVAAIHDADELVREADALAGKLEARECAIRSVRRIAMCLADALAPSRRLHTLLVRLTEQILAMEEVAMTIRWPSGGKDEFYNAAIWQQEVDVDRLLDEFCEA